MTDAQTIDLARVMVSVGHLCRSEPRNNERMFITSCQEIETRLYIRVFLAKRNGMLTVEKEHHFS